MDTHTTGLTGHVPAAAAEILDGLNDLLQLDHDAVGAYEIAMEKLEDREHAAQISGFLRDHERHIRELNELIADLGGTPVNQPHATGPLKLGLQSLGALAGDRGVLTAFRANELQVRSKYDAYASRANQWPATVKRMIDRAALDEERHYRWVAEALAAMGMGHGEGVEVDVIDAARERAAVAGQTLDAARERVTDLAGQARDKAGDLAGQAREMAGDLAGQAKEKAAEVAERVNAGAGAVRNRIQGLVSSREGGLYVDAALGDGGAGPLEPSAADQLRARAQSVAAGARGAGDEFERRYDERPLQTLLIAGIAGFVIGRLLR